MPDLGPSPLTSGQELSVDQAHAAITAALRPITETETLPLEQAAGRVLAGDMLSPLDVPAHYNSAMDGYALRACDLRRDRKSVV